MITEQEQQRRRCEVDEVRHSSEMEGGRSNDAARALQEAYVRGDLTLAELGEQTRALVIPGYRTRSGQSA